MTIIQRLKIHCYIFTHFKKVICIHLNMALMAFSSISSFLSISNLSRACGENNMGNKNINSFCKEAYTKRLFTYGGK